MTDDSSKFPIKSIEEIKLSNEEARLAKLEQLSVDIDPSFMPSGHLNVDKTWEVYDSSQYIIDPNKFSWTKVIRIVGHVLKFIHQIKIRLEHQTSTNVIDPVKEAKQYFFIKATYEIKTFCDPKKYSKISKETDGVLYYTGRILPTKKMTTSGKMTNAMLDLSASTFCVPLVYRHSPIAYSIVDSIHWYHKDAKHCGVETVLR